MSIMSCNSIVSRNTRDLDNVIQILNTYFIYMSETILMFNGQSIPVLIKRNDMAKVEQVEFLNIPLLRKAIGPVHFISLNRIYNFDINLYVSSEHFTFTKDYDIKEKIKSFIERHVGTVDEVDNEFILFTIRGPDGTEYIFSIDILYLDIEDGFIIEVSKVQMLNVQQQQYGTIYDEFVTNFMREFKPINQPIAIGLETF